VLSFGIPFAVVPLVRLTMRRELLGGSVNRWWTTVLAGIAAALLIALNTTLLALVLTGA
jgi:manganese transport protein